MAKKNLAEIAKKGKGTTPKTAPKTAKPKKVIENKETEVIESIEDKTNEVLNLIDDKQKKARIKVEELLQDIDMTQSVKKEIIEQDNEKNRNLEWLEDNYKLISDAYEKSRKEVSDLKEKLKENESYQTEKVVIKLFTEIQDNYFKMGKNRYGEPNLVISPVAFMNRLVTFFPFLAEHKKF